MPIMPMPDPKNPKAWIWVDSETGQPAPPPSGQQQWNPAVDPAPAQKAAQTQVASDASLQQAVDSFVGGPGWRVQGAPYAEETSVVNSTTQQVTKSPTGRYVYTITDGKGHSHPLFLKPTTIDPGGQPSAWALAGEQKATDLTNTDAGVKDQLPGPNGTVYQRGPDGKFHLIQEIPGETPNPDKDQLTAIQRQRAEMDRDERVANYQSGSGYLTDSERITFQIAGRKMGQDDQKIKLEQAKFEEEKRQADAMLGPKLAQAAAQTTLYNKQATEAEARAGLAGAQAGQVGSATDIAARKAGPEIEGLNLANKAAGAPTVIPQQAGPYTTTRSVTGDLTSQLTKGYLPKTQGEIGARMGQLQAAAQAKRAELNGKIDSKALTNEQATAEWNSWWDQNIEPEKPGLEAAQQEAQFQRTKEEAAMRGVAQTAALGAGSQAISAYNAQAPNRVGPGFADLVAKTKPGYTPSAQDFQNAFIVQNPDLNQQAAAATAAALQHISPAAAQQMGGPMPNYGAININEGLNRTSYGFGGGPPIPIGPPMGGGPQMGQPMGVGAPVAPVAPEAPQVFPPTHSWSGMPQPLQPMGMPGGMPAGWVPPGAAQYLGNYSYPG